MKSPEPLPPPIETQDGRSLRELVRSAVIWRSGTQIVGQLITWASTFLVIRILDPRDYGLYAMTAVILNLLSLVNGYSLANAAIQKRELTPLMLRQLLGMLVVLNLGLAAIQFAAAPFVAAYYGQPVVAEMLRVQCLLYVTNPFLALSYAVLSRRMDFKIQAQANLVSAILGSVAALGGAFAGLGVWALVIAPLVTFASRALIVTLASRSFVMPSFAFSGAWDMAAYGGTVLVGSFAWFIATQTDILMGGRVLDPAGLGFYTTALFLTQMFVTKFVPPVNEVAFSAYARIQDDPRAVAHAFLKATRIIFLAGMPFCLGMAAVAEPMVKVLLDTKWMDAAPIVGLLGLAMPFMAMQVLFGPTLNAIGKPGVTAVTSGIAAILLTACYAFGLQWGATGLAASWLVGYPLLVAMSAAIVLPKIGVHWSDYLRALLPPAAAGAMMYAGVRALTPMVEVPSPLLKLAILVAAGGAIYAAAMLLFGRERVGELLDLARSRKPA
ncbi:MAG: lipopolysaccharide biosynthesis protein [Erythrobacter sp.]